MPAVGAAVRVAVVNDYELVLVGVAALLARFSDRVLVVEIDARMSLRSKVDVILYDTFGKAHAAAGLAGLLEDGSVKVVIYSWNAHRGLVEESLAAGASGYVSKALRAEDLVVALEKIHAGAVLVPSDLDGVVDRHERVHPGHDIGLSEREAEILALITQGLSNEEIAQCCYLSINSVKTYIRSTYRKIGVHRRAQAVLWGVRNGFQPDVIRHTPPFDGTVERG